MSKTLVESLQLIARHFIFLKMNIWLTLLLLHRNIHVRLVELLRARLIDSGWRDDLKAYTKEKIQSKENNMSVDEIIKEVSPHARATIPDKVKTELLTQISAFVEETL
ncbi:hypothetical protein BGX27_005978 [Mortierella sp. AM989]|nr:hypothetical protein BGX27_005978 [Mortierella sp. AM989]